MGYKCFWFDGQGTFDGFVEALEVLGIPHDDEVATKPFVDKETASDVFSIENVEFQYPRLSRFTTHDGKSLVVEEHLVVRSDEDYFDASTIDISVYEEGNRPDLTSEYPKE